MNFSGNPLPIADREPSETDPAIQKLEIPASFSSDWLNEAATRKPVEPERLSRYARPVNREIGPFCITRLKSQTS